VIVRVAAAASAVLFLLVTAGLTPESRAADQPAAQGTIAHVMATGSYDEIADLLAIAIEKQGLVVANRAPVGEMLDRTGKDLGLPETIYERAEVLQFCSATHSRRLMQSDPTLLALCPFGIGIYTLPGQPGVVHLVYRRMSAAGARPEAADALKGVDAMLRAIVDEAAR
jgi:uncharacterized protein (DUF302 family)